MVTETRFGYTRFYNSVGTLLAGVRNVVDELKIPGLSGGDPVAWGIPSISIPTTRASATAPTARL